MPYACFFLNFYFQNKNSNYTVIDKKIGTKASEMEITYFLS